METDSDWAALIGCKVLAFEDEIISANIRKPEVEENGILFSRLADQHQHP